MPFSSTSGSNLTNPSRRLFQATILIIAGVWAYAPALTGGWIWDDASYLPNNPLLHDPARLWDIWFSPGSTPEYDPMTATVQYFQWLLWGNWTLPYHLTNLALHLLNALLLWRLLGKLGLRPAWLGGLIFAVHPLTVESVAWISELKNTLSLAFFLPAMIFYLDYDASGRERDYRLSLGFFTAAMLTKVTMAFFPLVILLHAWRKRKAVTPPDLRAAAPFAVVSVALVTLSIFAGHAYERIFPPTLSPATPGGWLAALASAGLLIFFYMARFFHPAHLLVIYPRWFEDGLRPSDFLAWFAILAVLGWLWWKRERRWCRDAVLGLGFYLLMLAPVLGFVVMRYPTMVWSLDHLAYLPLIGLIGVSVAVLEAALVPLSAPWRNAAAVLVAVIVALLAWRTHAYAAVFRDEETLWTSTLALNSNSWVAHERLGAVLQTQGHFTRAAAEYDKAAKLNPLSPDPHSDLAGIFMHTGRIPEAMAEYGQAIRLSPHDPLVHYNAGNALAQTGHFPEAIAEFKKALAVNPGLAQAHYNLGNALIQTGHAPEAAREYAAALRSNPDYEDAHANLGNVLLQLGQAQDALAEYNAALRLNPGDVDVRNNLGVALLQLGRPLDALTQFQAVLKLDPHNATAGAAVAQLAPGTAH